MAIYSNVKYCRIVWQQTALIMENIIAGKVSFSLKNAVSVNSNNSHKLLKTVKSLEAKRDQNLHSLQIEKDEVIQFSVKPVPIAKSGSRESDFLPEKHEVGNTFPHQDNALKQKKKLEKASTLPKLYKQVFTNKHREEARRLSGDILFREKVNPLSFHRGIGISNKKHRKSPSPPSSPKVQERNNDSQHLNLFKFGRGVPLNTTAKQLVEQSATSFSSQKILVKQQSLRSPQNLSSECHFDLTPQKLTTEKPESKQTSHSPKLNRPKTTAHLTFIRQRTLPSRLDESSSPFPDTRAPTAWNDAKESLSNSQAHRSLVLKPLYSTNEKEQTKRKNSDSVYARLHKTGAKHNNRKYRMGDDLDKLAESATDSSLPTRPSLTRLEHRRRSVSLPDLTEMLDNLKSCRYLRKESSEDKLEGLCE